MLCSSFPLHSGVCEKCGCVYIRWCKQHPKRSTVHTVGFIHSQVKNCIFSSVQSKYEIFKTLLEFYLWDLAFFFFHLLNMFCFWFSLVTCNDALNPFYSCHCQHKLSLRGISKCLWEKYTVLVWCWTSYRQFAICEGIV